MDFKEEILELEKINGVFDYLLVKGEIPVLITAPHTMEQVRSDGTIKYSEPFTKAIALYLNKVCSSSYLIKIKDTGKDSNRDKHDEFISIDLKRQAYAYSELDFEGALEFFRQLRKEL